MKNILTDNIPLCPEIDGKSNSIVLFDRWKKTGLLEGFENKKIARLCAILMNELSLQVWKDSNKNPLPVDYSQLECLIQYGIPAIRRAMRVLDQNEQEDQYDHRITIEVGDYSQFVGEK